MITTSQSTQTMVNMNPFSPVATDIQAFQRLLAAGSEMGKDHLAIRNVQAKDEDKTHQLQKVSDGLTKASDTISDVLKDVNKKLEGMGFGGGSDSNINKLDPRALLDGMFEKTMASMYVNYAGERGKNLSEDVERFYKK